MKVNLTQNGNMAFLASADSGHAIQMDASPDAGGENQGARPMELLLAGLGGCTSIDVVHILRKSRQTVNNCEVEITAERAETDPKVFTHIHVHFRITGEQLDPEKVARAVRLSADKYCSASIMLAKTAKIDHDFEIVETQ